MNIIENKIKEIFSEDNYLNIYYNIFEDIKYNSKILIINQHLLFSINKLAHYIKKYNLYFTFNIENDDDKNIFLNKIKGEEYENNIKTTNFLLSGELIYYDYIIIFHIYDKNYLNILLNSLNNFVNFDTKIYLYCSLCSKEEDINYKNNLRIIVKNITNLRFGNLLYYDDIIKNIENNNNFQIVKESIYRETKYILYGKNKLYEFILYKK